MSAKTKIIPISRGRKPLTRELSHCPICDYPSLTQRGSNQHYRLAHGRSARADRNWAILYMYAEEGVSVQELCTIYNLSTASIYRILQRGIMFPSIYELTNEP